MHPFTMCATIGWLDLSAFGFVEWARRGVENSGGTGGVDGHQHQCLWGDRGLAAIAMRLTTLSRGTDESILCSVFVCALWVP